MWYNIKLNKFSSLLITYKFKTNKIFNNLILFLKNLILLIKILIFLKIQKFCLKNYYFNFSFSDNSL